MSPYADVDASFRNRRGIFLGVLAVLFLVGVGRLFDLQVLHGAENRESSERNRLRREILRAPRGRVLDRNHDVLVDNFASFVLTLDPYDPALRHRLPEVVGRLASLIDQDSTAMRDRIERSRRQTFLPVRLARNLTDAEVARVEEQSAFLPGVRIRVEPLRHYPEGDLAAHALGYVGEISPEEFQRRELDGYAPDDQVGKSAIEERYDRLLHGRNGTRHVEVDAFGRPRSFSGVGEPVLPEPGADLVLTIDHRMQAALERAMDGVDTLAVERVAFGKPVVGAAVALDVMSGEILALVSRPTFPPQRFAEGMDARSWQEIRNNPDRPLLDRVIQSRYPPGSVFKPLVVIAALDSGLVSTGTLLRPCYGSMEYGRRRFRCWKPAGHGSLNLMGALEQSCDVYFYQLGDMLGVEGVARYARRFAMADPTGVDLDGEAPGLIPDSRYLTERYGRSGWSRGAALNLAIGQGELLFTPLQIAVHVAAIANGGFLVTPHLVKGAVYPGGRWEPITTPAPRPALHDFAALLRTVGRMMRRVVDGENGTAKLSRVDGLSIAGKTGTSENPHGEDHALFVSFAPAEDPEVALVVVLEQRGHGGAVAAPVAGEFWRAFQRLRVAPEAGSPS